MRTPDDRPTLQELEQEYAKSLARLEECAADWLDTRVRGRDTRTIENLLDSERRFSRRLEKKVRRECKRQRRPV